MTSNPAAVEKNAPLIIFRCDDYATDGGITEALEHQLVETFAKYGLKLVFGVIPNNLESRPEKIEYLKPYLKNGTVEVAMHGWEHRPFADLLSSAGIKSEFTGRNYEDQLERIARGKRLLEEWFEQPVDCFIPPYNNNDLNTVRACSEAGFKTLSANIYAPGSKNLPWPKFLPGTLTLDRFKSLLTTRDRSAASGRVVVLFFHIYEFYESKSGLANFSLAEFFQGVEQIALKKIYRCVTFKEAAEVLGPDLSPERYFAAQKVDRKAARIYSNRWLTRIGNRSHLLAPIEIPGYHSKSFYKLQYLKLLALENLAGLLAIFLIFLVILGLLNR